MSGNAVPAGHQVWVHHIGRYDLQIAAICVRHGFILVTSNVGEFSPKKIMRSRHSGFSDPKKHSRCGSTSP